MKNRWIVCVVLLVVPWIAPLSLTAQPLADRLPGDALMYAGWKGSEAVGAGYDGSRLKAVIDASNYSQFIHEFLPQVMQRFAKENRDFADVVPVLSTVGSAVWKHPTAIYVGAFDFQPNRPPMPRVALLCDAGADARSLLDQFNQLISKIPAGGPVTVAAKVQGELVVVTIGTMSPAFDQAVAGGAKDASLAGAKKFKGSFAQTQSDAVLAVYLDIEAVVAQVDQAVATERDESVKANWNKARDFLSLQGMKQLAIASGFDGKDWGTSAFFGAPAPRKGLLAMLDSTPLAADALKVVPKTATYAAAGKLSLMSLFNGLRAIAAQAPGGQEQFDTGVQQMSLGFGLDIQKDVLGAFGDDWVIYTDPNTGGEGLLGFVIVNHLADSSKAEATFSKVEQLLFQILAAQMHGSKVQISMQQAKVGDLTLHYLAVPLLSPTWAIKGGNLYVGLFPQTVAAGSDFVGSQAPSITENEAFKAVAAHLAEKAGGAKFTGISFMDLPRTAPQSYAMWVALSRYVGVADLFGIPSPPMLLPPLNKLLPQLAAGGSATWSDDAGFHARSVTPFPGADVIASDPLGGAALTAPLAVSVLLPSLSRARETANRVKCSSNLRQIGQGMLLYANDNNGKYPPDLGTLCSGDYISLGVAICPSANSSLPAGKLTLEQAAAWVNEHTDYVYLGAGMKNTAGADVITCYEKPENHHTGMNVLFGDGHVEFMMNDAALQMIQQRQAKPKAQ